MSSASQPGSSHSSAQNDPNYPQSPLSWEGDRMFNIYIYDYCFKRGFRKTARELLLEADLPPESQPPINARQGLLFEWWSVFWVLFTAKASGNGSEDALIYTQHQANQNRLRGQPLPPPGQPRPNVNGLPLPANRPFPTTGPITNGGPPGFPSGSHINGIPPPQGQSFPQQPMVGPQRTSIGARGSTGGGPPFPSPTMANSPHNPGQPPMNIGQSPHLNPRMPPPSSNGIHPGPGQLPGAYPVNRPPSRTASPGQMSGMMHSSPSMSSRLVPNDPRGSQDPLTSELLRIPHLALNGLRDELGLVGKEIHNMSLEEKQRINALWRQKGPTGRKPPNAAAGPSTMHPPQRRTGKRNSTSPREDPDNVPGTGSPPAKKPRRSPVDPPTGPAYQQHAPQPGQGPGQPGLNMGPPNGPGPGPGPGQPILGGMRPPMPGGAPGGPLSANGFNQPMGGGMSGMGPGGMSGPTPSHPMNAMSPPMSGGMPGQPGMMTSQMQPMNPPGRPPPLDGPMQYRQTLANFHRLGGGNTGSPSDPPFGGGPGPGRMSKHNSGLPMPPPSPGMNKDGSAKDLNMKMDGSPRGGLPPSSAGMTPTTSGSAIGHSSTPVPGGPPPSQNPSLNSGPNPGPPPPPSGMDSSSGSMLGNPSMSGSMSGPMPGMMPNGVGGPGGIGSGMVGMGSGMNPMNGGMGSDLPLFGADFMNDIGVGSLEFDPNLFRDPGGDLNFERDFGQWFNPNDQALEDPLDPMK